MPVITLPDNSQKQFDHPVTVLDVAQCIGSGLAKATLAGFVNDRLVDASFNIENDVNLKIITGRDKEGLEIIRHSTAHLLAQAVKAIFPTAQVTIGPVIEDGFYYDFAFGRAFTPEDLEKIEKKMHELAKQNLSVSHKTMSRDDAIKYFESIGEHYKVEIIRDIPVEQVLTVYQQGDFIDLCRGPHVPSTVKLGVFKLIKVAGAYWRGDSNNEMLQRIYGTAWSDKKELNAYLKRIEEAEKRDHRKLAKKLGLYHMQEESPGMAFWHDKGWTLYKLIENYVRDLLKDHGYQEVHTPIIADRSLWEKSGHWDKFSEEMFTTNSEDREYAIKPMSCPCHIQIYKQGLKSYRDLPLRLAEFGHCHRSEPSGALHGLMRARSFTQDDAHIFCTEDQIQTEVATCIDFLYQVYQDFGFGDLIVKLSTRPEDRIGADDIWDKAEVALEKSLNSKQINWELQPGEGAFYGPKIEFALKDCLGRVWQCGTIQIDFSMPERLGAEYVAEDGERRTPVMIHRAILGSMERFIAILIEHYEGIFPLWLAPTQAVIMNITDNQANYCQKMLETMKKQGIRVISDLRNEKIGFKIREHTLQRVPYLLIVGDKEVESDTVTVRTKAGDDLGSMSIADFVGKLQKEIATKGII